MSTTSVTVSGMTCGHCSGAVTQELSDVPGVTHVEVDLVPGGASDVRVDADPAPTAEQIIAAVAEAGDYTVSF